jgi:hypothetical protein
MEIFANGIQRYINFKKYITYLCIYLCLKPLEIPSKNIIFCDFTGDFNIATNLDNNIYKLRDHSSKQQYAQPVQKKYIKKFMDETIPKFLNLFDVSPPEPKPGEPAPAPAPAPSPSPSQLPPEDPQIQKKNDLVNKIRKYLKYYLNLLNIIMNDYKILLESESEEEAKRIIYEKYKNSSKFHLKKITQFSETLKTNITRIQNLTKILNSFQNNNGDGGSKTLDKGQEEIKDIFDNLDNQIKDIEQKEEIEELEKIFNNIDTDLLNVQLPELPKNELSLTKERVPVRVLDAPPGFSGKRFDGSYKNHTVQIGGYKFYY